MLVRTPSGCKEPRLYSVALWNMPRQIIPYFRMLCFARVVMASASGPSLCISM